ncbi:MAG: YHYH protein, partial [Bacteroidota bacterium]
CSCGEESTDIIGGSDDGTTNPSSCINAYPTDTSRGDCTETLAYTNTYNETITTRNRIISGNSIPNHQVGRFGSGNGSLNPNAISEQSVSYTITTAPSRAVSLTPLQDGGPPQYSFGVLLNGVELDPIAAEPFPHEGMFSTNANWDWNLEALNVRIGLDCNNAHVQPTGKYHYHGTPTLYLDEINASTNAMTLIGYAADGFPIYYKYAYADATDANSSIVAMRSSYQLKTGERPGDGVTAPCGEYNGAYSADYEYISGLGTLDEANGRTGVTPEYPAGTYYYVLTDEFPAIPRYFVGIPSDDFLLGR